MTYADNIWVGIEVSRQLRVLDGEIAPPGGMQVAGRNLLEHQLLLALELTRPEQICVLTPQGDAPTLELIAQHEVRELAPLDFIAMLSDRVKQGETGSVALLRQIAPLRDNADVRKALDMLNDHPVVVSATKPPDDHPRAKPHPRAPDAEPDPHCLAFEVRRMSEFGIDGAIGVASSEPTDLFIEWESFAEIIRPEDEAHAATLMRTWRGEA